MIDEVSNLSQWFTMGDAVTHFCGGSTDKEKANKPKDTQTQATNWFNPTKDLENGTFECLACGETTQTDGINFTTVGE